MEVEDLTRNLPKQLQFEILGCLLIDSRKGLTKNQSQWKRISFSCDIEATVSNLISQRDENSIITEQFIREYVWKIFLDDTSKYFTDYLETSSSRSHVNNPQTNKIQRVFTLQGGELDDIDYVLYGDRLLFTQGSDFVLQDRNHLVKKTRSDNGWVTLNIGGEVFATTLDTLTRDSNSMLAKMFGSMDWASSTDKNGAFLFDRNPEYFMPLLNYLRTGKLTLNESTNPEGVLDEARFFGITTVIDELTNLVDQRRSREEKLSRKEISSLLINSSINASLRLQGLNFSGVDLSRLDLSHVNFQMANLSYANLSKSNLDDALLQDADLSYSNLQQCKLRGANLARVNLEGAFLKGSDFEDRGGTKANLENANLKNALLEDVNFTGANLRAAILRGGSLENANLHKADLAGADLEGCNLKGANLSKANLSGANLHGANLDIRAVSSRQ